MLTKIMNVELFYVLYMQIYSAIYLFDRKIYLKIPNAELLFYVLLLRNG
jgi:hypothetical protein